MYKIGSLFSGIGGFELGLERAIPSETIWQVEQDKFCQSILKKHWPNAKIYDDVRNITKENVEVPDIICGGFPCQDLSVAGKQGGIRGEKSGLWWEMWRIISELSEGQKKPIVVLENVSNIIRLGGREVLGSLAQIGYNAEWTTIRASDFGAPHRRERWFCVAYPKNLPRLETNKKTMPVGSGGETRKNISFSDRGINATYPDSVRPQKQSTQSEPTQWKTPKMPKHGNRSNVYATDTNRDSEPSRPKHETPLERTSSNSKRERIKKQSIDTITMEKRHFTKRTSSKNGRVHSKNYWEQNAPESPLCNVDDGISQRVARLKALGNAIVPQCSEWIGKQIWESGILQGEKYV